ncbi:ROK family protein [Lentiprolixibacter aurantiacus]|uniref:ROK family protein n=1 Tax=Lentiprolixibacter aurantiacus TaxID=2993939 RepID=A0AAE3SNN2_9FLAO|nr:ROK family protein [Lentiprolixibacter aurantiacus]MCX2719819.1 ROK family protein [Lentiprolixibacter aurantiacus]
MMTEKIVLAIDIGGSLTKIGLVTRTGSILEKRVFRTNGQDPFNIFLEKLKSEIEILITSLDSTHKLISIGIGAPNANSLTGNIENPPNLSWGPLTPISKIIGETYNLPVVLANDANAAALGEMKFGTAKGMKHFVVLTLGTGLGSGIISDGKLLIGEHALAGEIGHVNVDPDGRQCNCGLQGCLETYASVTGIRRTVFELMAEMSADSPLRGISFEDMTGEHISDAALAGDAIALKAFDKTGEILGSKMADIVAHLDPEAIILSGGLSKAGDILLNPIKRFMELRLFNAYKGKVKVLISTTTSSDAILGPAALAWSALEKDTPNSPNS